MRAELTTGSTAAAAAAALGSPGPSSAARGLTLIVLRLLGAAFAGLRLPIQILDFAGLARTSSGLPWLVGLSIPSL
jgi:hypothetical protein